MHFLAFFSCLLKQYLLLLVPSRANAQTQTLNTETTMTILNIKINRTSSVNFDASKFAIKKAWQIARNKAVAHNTNPIDVALKGLLVPHDFMSDALTQAWKEAHAIKKGLPFYHVEKAHTFPTNKVKPIESAVAKFIVAKAIAGEKYTDLDLANVIFEARYGHESTKRKKAHIKAVLPQIFEERTLELDPKPYRVQRASMYYFDIKKAA